MTKYFSIKNSNEETSADSPHAEVSTMARGRKMGIKKIPNKESLEEKEKETLN